LDSQGESLKNDRAAIVKIAIMESLPIKELASSFEKHMEPLRNHLAILDNKINDKEKDMSFFTTAQRDSRTFFFPVLKRPSVSFSFFRSRLKTMQ